MVEGFNRENIVQDIKNKKWLEDTLKKNDQNFDSNIDVENFDFEKFDKAIEESFQNFLKKYTIKDREDRESIQLQFNKWLDKECEQLDIMKESEIEQKIIKPVSFELVWEATRTELEKFQKELLEADKRKSEASVDITVNEGELKWLTKLYNGVTKQEVVNLLGKDFDRRDDLLNLLKVKNPDNIKKFQRIIAWIDEDDRSKDHAPETNAKLGGTWVDWMFWRHTLETFEQYVKEKSNVVSKATATAPADQEQNNGAEKSASADQNEDGRDKNSTSVIYKGREVQAKEHTPTITNNWPEQNNSDSKEILNFNKMETIDEDIAKKIVEQEAWKEAINLNSLKKLSKGVATILAQFEWELYLGWLEEVDEEVLNEFAKGNCTKVHFPWWTLEKWDDETSFIIDGKTYEGITNNVYKLLGIRVKNAWSWIAWGVAPTSGWITSSSTTQTTTAQQGKWTTNWTKTGWNTKQPASKEALHEKWGMAMWEYVSLSSLTMINNVRDLNISERHYLEDLGGYITEILNDNNSDSMKNFYMKSAKHIFSPSWTITYKGTEMSVDDFFNKLSNWEIDNNIVKELKKARTQIYDTVWIENDDDGRHYNIKFKNVEIPEDVKIADEITQQEIDNLFNVLTKRNEIEISREKFNEIMKIYNAVEYDGKVDLVETIKESLQKPINWISSIQQRFWWGGWKTMSLPQFWDNWILNEETYNLMKAIPWLVFDGGGIIVDTMKNYEPLFDENFKLSDWLVEHDAQWNYIRMWGQKYREIKWEKFTWLWYRQNNKIFELWYFENGKINWRWIQSVYNWKEVSTRNTDWSDNDWAWWTLLPWESWENDYTWTEWSHAEVSWNGAVTESGPEAQETETVPEWYVLLSSLANEQQQEVENNKPGVYRAFFHNISLLQYGRANIADLEKLFVPSSTITYGGKRITVRSFLEKIQKKEIKTSDLNELKPNLSRSNLVVKDGDKYEPRIQNIVFSKQNEVMTQWESVEYSWTNQEIESAIKAELGKIATNFPDVKIRVDTENSDKYDFLIPKSLWSAGCMNVLCDWRLKKYIKTDEDNFIVPANIKVWLVKRGAVNDFVLWDYESQEWYELLTDDMSLTGEPSEYPLTQKTIFKVTDIGLGGWNESAASLEEYVNASKNEYHNLENDKYWEMSPEVMSTNYEAIIDYMHWQNNKDLIQAFQRLKINPNNIANTLAQILKDNPNIAMWSFTKDHISKEAMKQLWRNEKWFVNEKNNLVKILNTVDKEDLQKFINEMKVFNDIRELQKNKKFVELNAKKIITNPFLVLSDFNRSGDIGRWDEWLKNNMMTSEQAMYDVFLSYADTDPGVKWWYKEIIDWPKTADLVKWFVTMIKSLWEGRYEDIEKEFNGIYTMENLWKYIVKNEETLVLYQQTLRKLSENHSVDISDIVSYNRRQAVVDNKIQDVKELSTNRDEVQNWLRKQMENEKFRGEIDKLSAEEKANFFWNVSAFVAEHGLLREIVARFGISTKTWVTVDNLDAVQFEWHALKDNNWIWPRFSVGPLLDGMILHLDVPLANLTAKFDLNRSNVENSVINGVTPVRQLYTRLWANIGGWFSFPKDNPADLERWQAYLSAAIEWAVWMKADYKKGIELSSRNFWNVLQDQIFANPDFSSKSWFNTKAKQSIDKILQSKEKSDKNLKKFMENNKQEMYNCVDNVSEMLDVLWVFDTTKDIDINHKEILLNSIMKWVVESVKDQNLWELNGKTKLTSFWIWWQYWIGANLKELKNVRSREDLKKVFHIGWSAWIEATVSSWNMLYWPNEEKLKYMDNQLRSWESIKPLGEWIKTNNIENVQKAIMESLSENSIPTQVKSNDKWQIEISVSDVVLQKYGKNNIYELFNIYVNPEKSKYVAISGDGKTLTIWGNELKNFSVVTRRYFDEFAVYLMIGWKWIEECVNNKINEETVSGYNTQEHLNSVPWFVFEQPGVKTTIETQESTYSSILSSSEITNSFRDIEGVLSRVDDQKWNDYVRFMEATCDLDRDIVENSDYDDAFNKLNNMIDMSLKSGKLDNNIKNDIANIKNTINWITDFDQKVFVVDRFKMIFSLIPWTDSVEWLRKLAKRRWKTYESLMWYTDSKLSKKGATTPGEKFPLADKSYRDKLINSLWGGTVDRKPDSNLVGMTAFYKRWRAGVGENPDELIWQQLSQAYGYSMTEIWGTDYLWQLYPIEQDDLNDTKDWFINNLAKTQVHKNILKNAFSEKIWIGINDDQLYKLLRWEEVDINIDKWVKKVTIDVNYVFYLLWECANESIWVKLWSLKIVTEIPHEEPIPVEENVLDVWKEGQTVSKTSSLKQTDSSIKVSLLNGVVEETETETEQTTEPPTVTVTSSPTSEITETPQPPTVQPPTVVVTSLPTDIPTGPDIPTVTPSSIPTDLSSMDLLIER